MNTSRHIALTNRFVAFLVLVLGVIATSTAARSDGQSLLDGYYGIYDSNLPPYASMWDTVLVRNGRVEFDCGIIEPGEESCSTDPRIRYTQLNSIQIMRTDPEGTQTVITRFKDPE
jgi:hypothetical protein